MTENFSAIQAWAPAVGHYPAPADELAKQARIERAGAAVLQNLAQLIRLHEARNDSMGLSRLVIALGIIGAQAADCAEKIEARHDAAMKRAE